MFLNIRNCLVYNEQIGLTHYLFFPGQALEKVREYFLSTEKLTAKEKLTLSNTSGFALEFPYWVMDYKACIQAAWISTWIWCSFVCSRLPRHSCSVCDCK
jgi:hypothetical protein